MVSTLTAILWFAAIDLGVLGAWRLYQQGKIRPAKLATPADASTSRWLHTAILIILIIPIVIFLGPLLYIYSWLPGVRE